MTTRISIKVIKRFTKTSGTSRDMYVVDLDMEENQSLKDKEHVQFEERFSIVSRLVFANKSKDVFIYTKEADVLMEHLQELARRLENSIIVPSDSIPSTYSTKLLTAPLCDETRLDGGLTRFTIELKKGKNIRVEYYE